MPEFLRQLFDTSDFPARWHCGQWTSLHGWVHIISDVAVFGAYTAIPIVLFFFVRHRRDIPFPRIFWLFGAFIFACGTTHLIEALIFWWPVYRVSAAMKLFTGVVSWSTVLALIPVIPRALALRSPDALEREVAERTAEIAATNRKLSKEIDERTRAQRALEEARHAAELANRSKSEFVANMSHEIRTPMTAILGYADVLLSQSRTNDDRELAQTIKRNGAFLLELVSDILDLSKIEAGKLTIQRERFSPVEVIEDLHSLMQVRASERQLPLLIEYEGLVPETVESDPVRVRQVLVNLIGNAIKFTESGSVRTVVRLAGPPDARRLEFMVIDTGIGMSAEEYERIFEPFTQADGSVTRRYGGTGLGLTISRRLARMLGGDISVVSEVGAGSEFTFSIDAGSLEGVRLIQPGQDGRKPIETPVGPRERISARVLVVDDQRDLRSLAEYWIRDAGGEVECAEDGREALERVERATREGLPFDVILLDMQMPILDGYETARRLRASGSRSAIIALTANAMKGDRDRSIEAGCDTYLTKPFEPGELIALIGRVAAAARAHSSDRRVAASDVVSLHDDLSLPELPAPAKRRRVLLVEDGTDARRVIQLLLERRGHEVLEASTGAEAMEAFDGYRPDAILVDLGLPDMDGEALVRELRKMPGGTRSLVVAITGRDGVDRESLSESGFDAFLLKPFAFEDLDALLEGSAPSSK